MPNNSLSHEGVRTLCDRALAEGGIQITFDRRGEAVNIRQRIFKMREADRKASQHIYPEGDPRCGRSVYDALIVQLDDKVLRLVKGTLDHLKVEAINVK